LHCAQCSQCDLKASSHRHATDTTKLSCLCRVRFRGVNWIPDNSRLSPTENLKSERVNSSCPILTATPDTTQTDRTVSSCLVWRCELSRLDRQTCAFCDRRTHSDAGRTCLVDSIHTAATDTTRLPSVPACRPPPRRRPDRQLRLAARPLTHSDVVRHAECKHVVDCCI